MTTAKRRLSDFNFEGEGSHVALVGKHQGGPANGVTTLLTKSTEDISQQQVDKATMVQVEMNIVDFLTTFFNLWYEDAVVLAKIMGMDTEEEPEEVSDWWSNWIEERVDAVTIMKSVILDKSNEEVNKSIASLKPEELLSILEIQKEFEQNLSSKEGVTVSKGTTSPSVENNNKGKQMSEFMTKAAHEDAVQKAVDAAVAKAVQEKEQELVAKQAELDSAQETLKALETEKKESVEKARKETLKQAGVADEELEDLFKSMEALSAEAFDKIVKAMAKEKKLVEESDLFKEQGVSGAAETVEQDGVEALTKSLQQKYAK
jgi:hypothetical protein